MAEWKEDLHPRDEFGRWAEKGSTGAGGWALDSEDEKTVSRHRTLSSARQSAAVFGTYEPPSQDHRDAIQNFSAGMGRDVSVKLRLAGGAKRISPGERTMTALMDEMIESRRVPGPMVLSRVYELGSDFEKMLKTMKPGDTFRDPGFVSTTASEGDFLQSGIPFEYGIMRLLVSGDEPALYLGDLSQFPKQAEVVLGRGITFEYIGEKDDIRYFKAGVTAVKDKTHPLADKIAVLGDEPKVKHREGPLPGSKTKTKKYVRFGDLPEGGRSTVGAVPSVYARMAGVHEGQVLTGVSAFAVEYDKKRNLWKLDSDELAESGYASFDELVSQQDEYTSEIVGGGHYDDEVTGRHKWTPPVWEWSKTPDEDIRPIYLVEGDLADEEGGTDGEPLLKNVKVVDTLNVQDLLHDGYFDPDQDLDPERNPSAFGVGDGAGDEGETSNVDSAVSEVEKLPRFTRSGKPSKNGPDVQSPIAYDPEAEDRLDGLGIKREDFDDLPVEEVEISSLVAQQDQVSRDKVISMIKTDDDLGPITVVEYQGKKYIWDGNHRAAARKFRGDESINAKVLRIS